MQRHATPLAPKPAGPYAQATSAGSLGVLSLPRTTATATPTPPTPPPPPTALLLLLLLMPAAVNREH